MHTIKSVLVVMLTSWLLSAYAAMPMDQYKISGKTLKGLVLEGYKIVGFSTHHDPEANQAHTDYLLQKGVSVYLCNDKYRYKAATRELTCYELVEPFSHPR
jgi:hypothetical protein